MKIKINISEMDDYVPIIDMDEHNRPIIKYVPKEIKGWYKNIHKVGDEIEITLKDERKCHIRLIGIGQDIPEKKYLSKNKVYTFRVVECLERQSFEIASRWAEQVFIDLLPNEISKKIIKVKKSFNKSYSCFLPSEMEVFGRNIRSIENVDDNIWYQYYQKQFVPYYSVDMDKRCVNSWLRSSNITAFYSACSVNYIGVEQCFDKSIPFGVAPCFCVYIP